MSIQHSLITAAAISVSSMSYATIIQVDFSGSVNALGSQLTGDTVNMGDTVQGSFRYDSEGTGLDAFTIALGDSFVADMSDSGVISVQNDLQNGSATLPADGLYVRANATTSSINGHSGAWMQFGLLRNNIDGDLWNDTNPPDLDDWANITLADITKPGWHWMDFGISTSPYSADQIRWEINEFSYGAFSSVPEPGSIALFTLGLLGLSATRRRA